MKNVLVILNGRVIPQHVIDMAIQIAKNSDASLHVVFMNSALEFKEYNYIFPNDLSLTRNNLTGKTIAEEDREFLEINKQLFEDICHTANVPFRFEMDEIITLGRLIELSAFSDLILTDATENLEQYHIIDLLTKAHCPVYLVSKHVNKVENIILTYDGSFSSIHAIRQYALVFPEMKNLPTYLVHINTNDSDEFPREKNIKSWLPGHYNNVEFKILHGNVQEELIKYSRSIPGSIVVMGSFGRSALSRLFHKSMANAVIAEGKSALFIAHQ